MSETKRTYIHLPVALHRQIKTAAAQNDIHMVELFRILAMDFLDKTTAERRNTVKRRVA